MASRRETATPDKGQLVELPEEALDVAAGGAGVVSPSLKAIGSDVAAEPGGSGSQTSQDGLSNTMLVGEKHLRP